MADNKSHTLRGVNLGGWLVLERWITPSLFDGTSAQDEWSFMHEPGAAEKIERHRREFITEEDFVWLREQGVNAVRIPVGYWVFDGDAPFTACISYLDWAMKMAEKYDIKALIDLHAAKGSQNGKNHSGRIGRAGWFRSKIYRQETIEVLRRLAQRYRDSSALWGIELLNEPSLGLIKYFILKRFYRQAYNELAQVARPGTHIVFSDAFLPWLFSGVIKPQNDFPAVMDVHWYQFGFTRLDRYFAKLGKRTNEIGRLQRHQPVIIGEWSGMLSHETLAGTPEDRQAELQEQHIKRQLAAYEAAAGWFYWTYKTEGAGIWNFRVVAEQGKFLLKNQSGGTLEK